MEIKRLKEREIMVQNERLKKAHVQMKNLLVVLRKKELPDAIVLFINSKVDQLNAISTSEKELKKDLKQAQASILNKLEKELKLVTKNHYRNTWMAVGMAAFGIPLGVAFGATLGNMAFLGIGLPIGMVFGIAVGTNKDKKAFEEQRQLNIELN